MDKRKLIEEMARLSDEFKVADPREYYTDGKPDIAKLHAAGKTRLVRSFRADTSGKIVEVELFNDNVGYVYIIRSEVGLYKIGRTRKLERRLGQIRTFSPVPTEIYYSRHVRDSLDLEKILHKVFVKRREHGEWFRLGEAELAEAKRIVDGYE